MGGDSASHSRVFDPHGFLGAFLLVKKDRKTLLLIAIPIYIILLFPIVLKASEFRFFHIAYPFLLIGFIYLLLQLKVKYLNLKLLKK